MPALRNQRLLKARAIVIKEKSLGESNKQLTMFAKDMGKIVVSARGAKNRKSKFLSGAQQFCYCDFELYDGGGFTTVSQIDLIRNFSVEYGDIYKLMYGTYFLELADKTVMFSQEANDIMLLLLKALHILGKNDSPKKISAAFSLKLIDLLGFLPDVGVCAVCSSKLGGEAYFSHNGFFCKKCRGGEVISNGVLEALGYIKSTKEAEKVFMFSASLKLIEELSAFSEKLVRALLDIDSSSLEIIKKL